MTPEDEVIQSYFIRNLEEKRTYYGEMGRRMLRKLFSTYTQA